MLRSMKAKACKNYREYMREYTTVRSFCVLVNYICHTLNMQTLLKELKLLSLIETLNIIIFVE